MTVFICLFCNKRHWFGIVVFVSKRYLLRNCRLITSITTVLWIASGRSRSALDFNCSVMSLSDSFPCCYEFFRNLDLFMLVVDEICLGLSLVIEKYTSSSIATVWHWRNNWYLIFSSLSCFDLDSQNDDETHLGRKVHQSYSTSAPASTNCLLGSFEVLRFHLSDHDLLCRKIDLNLQFK